jgi:hypothetical protein
MSRLFQFALFFFSAIPLTSQIFDLAVTTPFRQRGTDQYTHTKLFRIAENGLELVAQTERRMEGANTSNYYAPVEASVSGAGTLLAYTLRRDCIGGSGCVFVERNRGIVRGPAVAQVAQPMEFQGRLQVSRNGRYVLQYGVISPVAVPMFLTDLSAATSVEIPGRTTIEPQGITNDGQVLMRSADGVRLWTPAASRTVLPGDAASSAVVNPTGRVVVCLLRSGEIRAIDVVSGGSALLPPGSGHSISNDGQWILYRNRDVFLVRSDGSGNRRLTSLNEEVVAATLTGDANAAFVATSGGRLLRIELPSGESRELVPRTPFLRERTGAPVAGSLNWLRGSGFQGTTSVLIGDVPAPLLSVGPEEILFQIPWEVRGGPIPVVLQPNDSPFESARSAVHAPDVPLLRPGRDTAARRGIWRDRHSPGLLVSG